MSFYEIVSLVNFILPLLASIGYFLRIIMGFRKHNSNVFRIMLPLYLILAMGGCFIYLLNITGWWQLLEPDYETYSRVYIRPYFTYLGSILVLSAWIHPDLHPFILKIKEIPWILKHGLKSKKK